MAEHRCADCGFRKKYDERPDSFLGRVWHWHTRWCPGWKRYLASLTEDEREALRKRYRFD